MRPPTAGERGARNLSRDLAQALYEATRAVGGPDTVQAHDVAAALGSDSSLGSRVSNGSSNGNAHARPTASPRRAVPAAPATRSTARADDTRPGRERSRDDATAAAAPRAPTIGVVVPTLDEELLLPRLLDRLLDPSGLHDPDDRADAVVVVDADSRDRTRAIARVHGAEVILAPPSRGVQLATGAHALSTDVLLFLHADCLPRRGALARIRAAFALPEVDAVSMHQDIECDGALYRWIERCADLRSRLGLVWGDSGLGVRREVYRELGGFAPLELFEDVDFSLRLRREVRIHWLEDAVLAISARRWREEGALRCTWRNWMLCARFFLGADPRRLATEYRAHGHPG